MNSAMIVIGVMMLGEDHLLGESGEPGVWWVLKDGEKLAKYFGGRVLQRRKGKEKDYVQRICTYIDMGGLGMLGQVFQYSRS